MGPGKLAPGMEPGRTDNATRGPRESTNEDVKAKQEVVRQTNNPIALILYAPAYAGKPAGASKLARLAFRRRKGIGLSGHDRNCLQVLRGMAGTTGLEPAASAVTGQRSNQLNYVPTPLFQTLTSVPDFRGGIFGCKRRNRSMTRARCGSVLRRRRLRIDIHRSVLVLSCGYSRSASRLRSKSSKRFYQLRNPI